MSSGCVTLTPNELALTFGGCYLCATFGENRSRNATTRVRTDTQTDTRCEGANWFIICPMLYATAMRQIKTIAQTQDKKWQGNNRNLNRFQAGELRLECRTNPPVDLNYKQLCLLTYSLVTVFQQRLQLLQQRLYWDHFGSKVPTWHINTNVLRGKIYSIKQLIKPTE